MQATRSHGIIRDVQRLFENGAVGQLTDGQLLERFATRTGESAEFAFSALIERHGAMVLHVCRSVLRDEHDAEDAFQAVFLVLVNKARGLWVKDSLGPWLHAVACRVAACALNARRRRARAEHKFRDQHDNANALEASIAAFIPELHEEIERLPARFRAVVVLCDLEGRTYEQVARSLRCPIGTVRSRLARGRERLRARLVKRGLAPAVGIWPVLTAPRAIVDATARCAVAQVAPKSAAMLAAAALRSLAFVRAKMAVAAVFALAAAGFVAIPAASSKFASTPRTVAAAPVVQEKKNVHGQYTSERWTNLVVNVVNVDKIPARRIVATLWKSVQPPIEQPNPNAKLHRFVWVDSASGRHWMQYAELSAIGGPSAKFKKWVTAGEYRVIATTDDRSRRGDPTPIAVSEIIKLAGEKEYEVSLRLVKGEPLMVRVKDRATNAPIPRYSFRIVQLDGVPVVHNFMEGDYDEWQVSTTNEHGEAWFRSISPGEYRVLLMGREPTAFDELRYLKQPEMPRSLIVKKGQENRLELNVAGGLRVTAAELDERWPFIVKGTARDEQGKPLAGVEISVHNGVGTLRRSAWTTTGEDGSYQVRFASGSGIHGAQVTGQAAIVTAHKRGLYEKNLSRQGDRVLASERLKDYERTIYASSLKNGDEILPLKPATVDFVMSPAARVEGVLKDAEGAPIAKRTVWLGGDELPPAANVLDTAETDAEGRFTFADVPLKSFWLIMRGKDRNEPRSKPMVFDKPETYRIEATARSMAGPKPRLEVNVSANP